MKKNTREVAADLLHEILNQGAYANLSLHKALSSFGDRRDHGFVTNLVYGTVRRLQPIDYQISQFLKKPIKAKDAYLNDLLRAAFFEILYTAAKPHAIVNEYVNIGKRRGNEGWGKMLNGVLRNLLRQKEGLSWPVFTSDFEKEAFFASLPSWITKLWLEEQGEEAALKLIRSVDAVHPPVLRTNTLKISREDLMLRLKEEGIIVKEGNLGVDALRLSDGADVGRLSLFQKGFFTVQEESSQLVAAVMKPQKEESILDMCAAPGGKTTHMAQKMENKGAIAASDIYDHKIKLIRENAERLGISIIKAQKKDALTWPKEHTKAFDAVLLDAPCSGLGVLNHRADSRLRKKPEDIEALATLQRELMAAAYQCVKPGGRLLYSTCTISKKENRDNTDWFSKTYPDMKPLDFSDRISGLNREEQKQASLGYLELMPYAHDTDGFFIALWQKEKND